MKMESPLPQLEVDFNERQYGLLVTTAAESLSLSVGDAALLSDQQDNTCLGKVALLEDDKIYIELERATWNQPRDFLTEIVEGRAAESPGFLDALR